MTNDDWLVKRQNMVKETIGTMFTSEGDLIPKQSISDLETLLAQTEGFPVHLMALGIACKHVESADNTKGSLFENVITRSGVYLADKGMGAFQIVSETLTTDRNAIYYTGYFKTEMAKFNAYLRINELDPLRRYCKLTRHRVYPLSNGDVTKLVSFIRGYTGCYDQ